jgi:hypothetical protein
VQARKHEFSSRLLKKLAEEALGFFVVGDSFEPRGVSEGWTQGQDRMSRALFSYVDVEARIPAKHPLRTMRRLTHAALDELNARFSVLYEAVGHPSIPPEQLLRAALLQLLYSIRSERQLVERIEFDLLARWVEGAHTAHRTTGHAEAGRSAGFQRGGFERNDAEHHRPHGRGVRRQRHRDLFGRRGPAAR